MDSVMYCKVSSDFDFEAGKSISKLSKIKAQKMWKWLDTHD